MGFGERKGLQDYIQLSESLPDNYQVILVGVANDDKKLLPHNVIGIERTNNQIELASLYSMADILLSLSTAETFGMTMAEALACGTPCIVYDNTAHPEIVTPETGRVVKTHDVATLYETIKEMIDGDFKQLHSADCRKRAEECFDKDKSFGRYVELYEMMLKYIHLH